MVVAGPSETLVYTYIRGIVPHVTSFSMLSSKKTSYIASLMLAKHYIDQEKKISKPVR